MAQLDADTLAVEAVYDVDPGQLGGVWAGPDLVWVRGDQRTFLTAIDPVRHRVVYQISADDLPSGGEVLGVGDQLLGHRVRRRHGGQAASAGEVRARPPRAVDSGWTILDSNQ